MSQVKLLDCTLRDGGHVNNFNFGQSNILNLIKLINSSKVDFIEIGFLSDTNYDIKKTKFNKVSQAEKMLPETNLNSKFALMIRPDWYDINKLEKSDKIDLIRFAFYEKDLDLTISYAKRAKDLGYKVFLNPVNVTGYSYNNLKAVLEKGKKIKPYGVSIVDTFGTLSEKSLIPLLGLFNEILPRDTIIGLHLHENLSLSFSLAQFFLKHMSKDRQLVIDSSILGMGRIPGNLPTELIMPYLNANKSKFYDLFPILEAAEKIISPIKKKIPWGYSPEYALSAELGVHRSYPEFFVKEKGLSLIDIASILKKIAADNNGSNFDISLANEYANKCL